CITAAANPIQDMDDNILNNDNTSSTSAASDPVLHSGFLTKQGGTVHNWKIRWFILKKDTLYYYVTNVNWEKQRPRGVVYLGKGVEVSEVNYKGRKYCFQIVPPLQQQQQQQLQQQQLSTSPGSSSPGLLGTSPPKSAYYDDDIAMGYGCLPTSSLTGPPQPRVYLISAQTVFDQKKWIEKLKEVINSNSTPQSTFRKPVHDQISASIKDMATDRDSFAQSPSLLNRRESMDSVNNLIKVSLSKRKFYFYHDDLTVPELAFIESPPPARKITSPFYSPVTHLNSPSQLSASPPLSSSSSSSSSHSLSPLSTSPVSPSTSLHGGGVMMHVPISSAPMPTGSKQPKIVVHHIAKDSFQINNLGQCPINFQILSPFDVNYTLSFHPATGTIAIGETLQVAVELVVYTHVEADIYSTVCIRGGGEFTLFTRVVSDPILPLFLRACNGTVLNDADSAQMYGYIKEKPAVMKRLQELAHTMIANGQHINPKEYALGALSLTGSGAGIPRYIHSRVRISKYVLTFGKQGDQTANIYQLLTEKFLISNSGDTDISFQFHQPNLKRNQFNLSMVPRNGNLARGEWFYIKCSMTVFEQIEVNEVIQLIINQREVHYILVKIKCENIHAGNKEIDLESELVIQDQLGHGAAGEVFRALISVNNLKGHLTRNSYERGNWIRRHPTDNTIMVAVKRLHQLAEPSPEIIQDFYSEVKVLSMLNHPNIVKYVGGCTKIGNWAIVMEYLPCGNLMDVLADDIVPIPFALVLRMALDIAQGLHYLHSLGIWHLDLKSPNLLVNSLSLKASVNIKVADFNTCINKSRITGRKYHSLTQSINQSVTDTRTHKGTTLWMSPEVIRGDVYSEKCDVYSYGIILWEMLTRRLPYEDVVFNCEIERQVLKGRRPELPIPNCPPDYLHLMTSCWDQDPEVRPQFDQIVHSLNRMISNYDIQEQKAKASFRGLRRTNSSSSIHIPPALENNNSNNNSNTNSNTLAPPANANDVRKSKIRMNTKRQSSDSSFLSTTFDSRRSRGSSILPFKFSPPTTPHGSAYFGKTTRPSSTTSTISTTNITSTTTTTTNNNSHGEQDLISIPLPNEQSSLNLPASIINMKAGVRSTVRFNPSYTKVGVTNK
ncbi:hypothetical protein SAMD00019534_031590, partial [Acytostelium subglobosum LB1]|uniref:hypothetical protein n=1 Tax=Acytostelium subglobosum LB1 TaxID=1410327 RepID=UPI000644FA44